MSAVVSDKLEMPRKYVPPPLELVKSRIEEVLPPDARREIDSEGPALIDVRDPERFQTGRIAGAVNVNAGQSARDAHEEAFAEAVASVAGDRGRRIILYCGEGNRSARASDALGNEHGFENVVSIIGGLKLWHDLDYPVEGEIGEHVDDLEVQEGGEG